MVDFNESDFPCHHVQWCLLLLLVRVDHIHIFYLHFYLYSRVLKNNNVL